MSDTSGARSFAKADGDEAVRLLRALSVARHARALAWHEWCVVECCGEPEREHAGRAAYLAACSAYEQTSLSEVHALADRLEKSNA